MENGVQASDIVINHAMDIGTNVFTANVVDIFTGLVPETKPDILMPASSSNYDLIHGKDLTLYLPITII